jgi:hypothetical protein
VKVKVHAIFEKGRIMKVLGFVFTLFERFNTRWKSNTINHDALRKGGVRRFGDVRFKFALSPYYDAGDVLL